MEVGDRAGAVRLNGGQPRTDIGQSHQGDGQADDAVHQVAKRKPLGGGIAVRGAFEHRVDGGAEIGA